MKTHVLSMLAKGVETRKHNSGFEHVKSSHSDLEYTLYM